MNKAYLILALTTCQEVLRAGIKIMGQSDTINTQDPAKNNFVTNNKETVTAVAFHGEH